MARFGRARIGRQSLIVGVPGFGGPKGYMNRGSRDRLYTGEFVSARVVGGELHAVWRMSDAGPTAEEVLLTGDLGVEAQESALLVGEAIAGSAGRMVARKSDTGPVMDTFAGSVKVTDKIAREGIISDRVVGQQDLDVQARMAGGPVEDGILGGPWYAWVKVDGGPVLDAAPSGPAKIQVRKSDAGPVADMVAQGFVKAEARPGVLIIRDDHLSSNTTAYAAAIEGVTRDKDGNAIGSVTVWLFRANGAEDRIFVTETTSDASGNYRVIDLSTSGNHFVYCHKADSPHIFGASDKELTVQLTQIFP